ncbi:reverse transcriptase domain-containing protein [Tanacetum coccineum]
MYLAASIESISDALLAKREKRQVPIYFVSRVLQGAELNYQELENLILALVYVARRLRRGDSSSDGSGADLMLVSPEGKEYTYALRFEFETTNNEAEYEALLADLRIVEEMEIKNLVIYIYSQVVVNQVKGLVEARQHVIKQYLKKMKEILKSFDTYSMEYIRRNQNKKTDALSKMAFVTFEHLTKEVLVEVLANRSINSKEVSTITADTEEN